MIYPIDKLPEAQVTLIEMKDGNYSKLLLTKGETNADETTEEFIQRVHTKMRRLYLKEYDTKLSVINGSSHG